jgi:DNA replication protein DnaC
MDQMPHDFYVNKWDRARIPIKFRGMRFDDYSHPHPTGRMALANARNFVENFTNHYVSAKRAKAGRFPEDRSDIGKGMLLYGPNGTRKTTLASITLTEIIYKYPQADVLYIRMADWKRAMTDSFANEVTERTVQARELLRHVELAHFLVLDDMGQEHRTATGFTEKEFHELLRIRYESARPTEVTTNVDEKSFGRIYGESFDSFRHDAFNLHPILGDDTRLLKD